jgi:hypothetical protein
MHLTNFARVDATNSEQKTPLQKVVFLQITCSKIRNNEFRSGQATGHNRESGAI